MTKLEFYSLLPWLSVGFFVWAYGACIGSLINVLVYRLPRGLDVVRPTSRCPSCQTKLTWRENIPVFGWLMLRGRCRFCGEKISPEYPIVEALVAFLFLGVYLLWYLPEAGAPGLGGIRPEWAANDAGRAWPAATWPAFVVLLVLLSGLVAMTIVDAKTFTIPLVLAWVPLVVGVVGHTGHAAWFEITHGSIQAFAPGRWLFESGAPWRSAPGWLWTLATPDPNDWRTIGAVLGGVVGLGVSNAMLGLGLIRRSFGDYEDWEAEARAAQRELGEGGEAPEDDPSMWIQYPHARREMVLEMAFLGPVAIGLLAGGWLLGGTGPVSMTGPAPLWLVVLSGCLLGVLVGGGIVWGVRILGSLAFGKEAMGLGDVHLMAAVGACLGWIDALLGFFGAAFVGLAWAIATGLSRGKAPRAMPYGPFLAVSTVLVLLGKPWIELWLTRMFGGASPVHIP